MHTPPCLQESEIQLITEKAVQSPRRRYAEILHPPGDRLNRVINCICHNSYMQPHLHPGPEKIEEITVLRGKLSLLFFGNLGRVVKSKTLCDGGECFIRVPAFAWHTYVIDSPICITYETMEGRYDPKTWKEMAPWAPKENTEQADKYLVSLKKTAGFSAY